ncbi:hypothetical protein M9458_034250, partial [Cirrhinus mrigala]
EPECFQIRGENQHLAAATAHRLKWAKHHRSYACVAGGAHPKPRPRATGHRKSASDWPDQ